MVQTVHEVHAVQMVPFVPHVPFQGFFQNFGRVGPNWIIWDDGGQRNFKLIKGIH